MSPVQPTRALTYESLRQGTAELARRDADLAGLVHRHGVPPMWARRPGFASLIRIVLEQQVSLAAARTLFTRVARSLGGMTPERVHACGEQGLRALGLTRQKAAYCAGIAARVREGRLDLGAIARQNDDDGQRSLLEVPGLGPWTVAIYYVMVLRRPDVWPMGDLALAVSMQAVKSLSAKPTADEQARLAAAWSPWRSVAARLLWQDYLARAASPSEGRTAAVARAKQSAEDRRRRVGRSGR